MKHTGMGYFDVLKLPYPVFLGLIKQFTIFELEETEEGREYLADAKRLNQKEADLSALRNSVFYKKR